MAKTTTKTTGKKSSFKTSGVKTSSVKTSNRTVRGAKKDKLRIAFIGAGAIAGTHMTRLATMEDVELVALADVHEPNLAKHGDKYNIAARYTDYEKMLREVKPDAVSVCTPNYLHAPAAIAALESGAHVTVEKPMAMNATDAQAMVDTAKKHNRKLTIAFQWRFDPRAQFLRRAREEGQFGNILYARVQALRRRGIPNWGVFGRKDLQGGGPMIDIGVHMLEVTHYVMGSPKPVSASGQTFTYHGNKPSNTLSVWPNWDHKTYTVEDLAVGQIRFDTGAVLTIESSFVAHTEKNVLNFEIMGEKAGGTFDPVAIFRDDVGTMVDIKPHWLPTVDPFHEKMRDFVDHVLYDKPTALPAEHGVMVQRMLDGIYASAASGKEVSL